jgi:hypothetical protein
MNSVYKNGHIVKKSMGKKVKDHMSNVLSNPQIGGVSDPDKLSQGGAIAPAKMIPDFTAHHHHFCIAGMLLEKCFSLPNDGGIVTTLLNRGLQPKTSRQ